jgi:hypothetical protein
MDSTGRLENRCRPDAQVATLKKAHVRPPPPTARDAEQYADLRAR